MADSETTVLDLGRTDVPVVFRCVLCAWIGPHPGNDNVAPLQSNPCILCYWSSTWRTILGQCAGPENAPKSYCLVRKPSIFRGRLNCRKTLSGFFISLKARRFPCCIKNPSGIDLLLDPCIGHYRFLFWMVERRCGRQASFESQTQVLSRPRNGHVLARNVVGCELL